MPRPRPAPTVSGACSSLTTQAEDWFAERGFVPACIDDLPVSRQVLYNYQRNSKVMIKELEGNGR